MTVYVDNMFARADVPNGAHVVRGVWCHMLADSHGELVAMARKIGMRTSWIQKPGTWEEHFDVTKTTRALALKNGAQELPIGATWMLFLLERRVRMAPDGDPLRQKALASAETARKAAAAGEDYADDARTASITLLRAVRDRMLEDHQAGKHGGSHPNENEVQVSNFVPGCSACTR